MGKLQNIVLGQYPIVSEKSVYLISGGEESDRAYGHPGYGQVPENALVPLNVVNGNTDKYVTGTGVNLYHSKKILDTTATATAIEFPFLDNKSYNIRAIVIYNRDDSETAARRLNGIEIYGLKKLEPNDDVFERPPSGVPGHGAPACPSLDNRKLNQQAVQIAELKLDQSSDLDITRADGGNPNKAITFLPNVHLDKTHKFTQKLSPLNSPGARPPFNKIFGNQKFQGLRIEKLPVETTSHSYLHFREIQVFAEEEAVQSFDCKGNGIGLPCNKICGNKTMYGGPSRGGNASSIGRSGPVIRMIGRQATIVKPKCPPN